MSKKWEYQFPAYAKLDGVSLEQQIERIHEEVDEARAEIDSDQCIIEIMDIIHAAETALRMAYEEYAASIRGIGWLNPCTLDEFKAVVIRKNGVRGYYGEVEEDGE